MSSESDSTTRHIGNVKWFNNKAGFGFITMGENTDTPKDIFAHYSNINVKNSQYKYLVQGEYVEFEITPTEGEHEFQATNITGIQGGATLCERRRMYRESNLDSTLESTLEEPPREKAPREKPSRPRPSTSTIRRTRTNEPSSENNDDGFTTVKKRSLPKK